MVHWFSKLQRICSIPDGILVSQAKHGNAGAFGKLYNRHLGGIYRYCYFHMNRHIQEAEDMTQTIFIKAWKHLDAFDGKHVNAWLFRIAHNTLIDHYRTVKQSEPLLETIPHPVGGTEQLETFAQKELIEKALLHVTPEQKTVILLRFVEGFSPGETARIMGKTTEGIRAMQHRALKQLRKHIAI